MSITLYAAFSGGIDSTALCLLHPEATPVFTDTGWEFNELLKHVARFEAVTGRKVEKPVSKYGGLPDYIAAQKFMPNHGARYCTRMFKIDPLNKWLKDADRLPATLYIGLRADEPADKRIGNLTEMDGLTIRYPLREAGLTRMDCLEVCIQHDLLPRYPVYMARGGCKGCFYKRKSEVEAMHRFALEELDELQALEEAVQDERGAYFHMFPNIGMSIRDFRAQLDAQPALFDMTQLYKDAADDSDKAPACGLFCHR